VLPLAQVVTQRDLLTDHVENQVRTLLDQVDEARDRAGAQRLALSQATRGFEIASAQYREGISSQLEVTDAEVALRQSEFNLAESVYDYLVARARLDEALGLGPAIDGEGRVAFNRESGDR
jgi:outer membrane protein